VLSNRLRHNFFLLSLLLLLSYYDNFATWRFLLFCFHFFLTKKKNKLEFSLETRVLCIRLIWVWNCVKYFLRLYVDCINKRTNEMRYKQLTLLNLWIQCEIGWIVTIKSSSSSTRCSTHSMTLSHRILFYLILLYSDSIQHPTKTFKF
jgi:hypothetical protein